MNYPTVSGFVFIITVLGVTISSSRGQGVSDWQEFASSERQKRAKQVMQDNEFQRSAVGQDAVIHCNPLRLNGHPLEYEHFSIHSRGVLTVVEGDPATDDTNPIPFQIYLRRNGKIIADYASGFSGEARTNIDLGWVLARSQPGDQLIINPVKKEHWKAKRILKIIR